MIIRHAYYYLNWGHCPIFIKYECTVYTYLNLRISIDRLKVLNIIKQLLDNFFSIRSIFWKLAIDLIIAWLLSTPCANSNKTDSQYIQEMTIKYKTHV